jgi:hypothetical protein
LLAFDLKCAGSTFMIERASSSADAPAFALSAQPNAQSSCVASQGPRQRVNPAAVVYSTMAHSSITTTIAGHGNQGLQVGYNSGSIHVAAFGKCSPASALTNAVLTTLLYAERPETPPQPSCFVPFRRDADFVDCGTLLDQIREQCFTPASRVALVGLGGVG